MLLAADIGNTNITLAAFRGRRLVKRWRLISDPRRSAAAYARDLARIGGRRGFEAVIYGSVVPKLDRTFALAVRRRFGVMPIAVTPRSKLGFEIRVDKPSEVGADRLLNSLAAYRLFGGPAIVLDFGTATTFDCIAANGDYLGGAILLGPELAAKALRLYTAKLPEVKVAPTRRVIGKNTVECIQAGLYHGYVGMVERVLRLTVLELTRGRRRKVNILATGGLARPFARALPMVRRVVPDLTLLGLRDAYALLSGQR